MTKKSTPNYAEATAEIEEILQQIEREELDVDHLSQKVHRVNVLITQCKEKLFQTQQEVEQIMKSVSQENG